MVTNNWWNYVVYRKYHWTNWLTNQNESFWWTESKDTNLEIPSTSSAPAYASTHPHLCIHVKLRKHYSPIFIALCFKDGVCVCWWKQECVWMDMSFGPSLMTAREHEASLMHSLTLFSLLRKRPLPSPDRTEPVLKTGVMFDRQFSSCFFFFNLLFYLHSLGWEHRLCEMEGWSGKSRDESRQESG